MKVRKPGLSKRHKRPSWCIFFRVYKGQSDQPDENGNWRRIYLGARNGGEAKVSALSKTQGELNRYPEDLKGLRIDVLIRCVGKNGSGKGSAPVYILRERYSYCLAFLCAHRASRVFRTCRD